MEAVLAALRVGDVALVSEAGMPGLADPGFELVQAANEQGARIVSIPGPTALSAALSITDLSTERFTFLGFLPRNRGARRDLLSAMKESDQAVVAYESPHRLLSTLGDMSSILGDRPILVACELTKLYEEILRGTPGEILAGFQTRNPRGEYTIVVSPPSPSEALEVDTRD